jgi:hypothetical protein
MPRSRGSRNRARGGARRSRRGGRGRGRNATDFRPSMGGSPVSEISSMPRQVQPVPNSIRMTLVHTLTGFIAATGSSGQYGMALNNLVTPASLKGGATNTFPNISGGSPAGLLNWLQNTGTGTGFYQKCVVHASRVALNVQPQSPLDGVHVALSAVAGTVSYAGTVSAADGPNSIFKTISEGQNRATNTLAMRIIPRLIDGFAASVWKVPGAFTSTTAPTSQVFIQMNWVITDATPLAQNLPYSIRLEHDVEFFQRTDTTLED